MQVDAAAKSVKITCNSEPLQAYVSLLKQFGESVQGFFDLRNFPLELVRIEIDFNATNAGELFVILYPSDALLRFAATVTGNGNFGVIKKSGHRATS